MTRTRTRKPPADPPLEECPLTGTHCSDCGQPLRLTRSGVTCETHGDATALEDTRAASASLIPQGYPVALSYPSGAPRHDLDGHTLADGEHSDDCTLGLGGSCDCHVGYVDTKKFSAKVGNDLERRVAVHASIGAGGEIVPLVPEMVEPARKANAARRARAAPKTAPDFVRTAGSVVSKQIEPGIVATVITPPSHGSPTGGTPRRTTVWVEDDATPGTDGHESIDAAWLRICGVKLDTIDAIRVVDHGDCTEYHMPCGRIACTSYPGASTIEFDPDEYPSLTFVHKGKPTRAVPPDPEHVEPEVVAAAIAAVKNSAERSKKVKTTASHAGLRFVSVPTRELVETHDPEALLAGPRVDGAIVKVSPNVKASERDAFDGVGIKARLMKHGAAAVLMSPRVVADSGITKKAKAAAASAQSPEQAVLEWFAGQTGLTKEEREDAIELALEILGAAS